MPFSDAEGKEWSKERVLALAPFRLWDVGPGAGTYSTLLRPYLPFTWFYAVEIWEPYIEAYDLDAKYHQVFVSDVMDFSFDPVGSRDLVILGDVVEHLTENDARELIAYLKERFSNILVSLPIVHSPQGTVFGNPYEAHLHQWSFKDMLELMDHCEALEGSTLGVFWWRKEDGDE
ncbi:class I SAM-dependent methyltransferase [Saccharothrix sp. HUAS TT1]|uniref:class I SAM-dependent methyltransferase n=1 Tax=unclassified Saccharothrix TaxID=2593673 RepID=UPI00345B7E35